jgi:hypothetical protein
MFVKVDCLQLEVNPLALTPDGIIYTADAKLGFDDNAKFRQKAVFEMEDTTELDPRNDQIRQQISCGLQDLVGDNELLFFYAFLCRIRFQRGIGHRFVNTMFCIHVAICYN